MLPSVLPRPGIYPSNIAHVRSHSPVFKPRPQRAPQSIRAISASSESSRNFKHAAVAVASAAALAGTAFVLVRQLQRQGDAASTPREMGSGGPSNTHGYKQSNPRWFGLGQWRSVDEELALIEAIRSREAAEELHQWDKRLTLRTKSLAELRNMAA